MPYARFATSLYRESRRVLPCRGRLIVSVNNPAIAGLTLYEALADREDRSHSHNYTGSVSIPSKNIAADKYDRPLDCLSVFYHTSSPQQLLQH
jgi:hypothetical protein